MHGDVVALERRDVMPFGAPSWARKRPNGRSVHRGPGSPQSVGFVDRVTLFGVAMSTRPEPIVDAHALHAMSVGLAHVNIRFSGVPEVNALGMFPSTCRSSL